MNVYEAFNVIASKFHCVNLTRCNSLHDVLELRITSWNTSFVLSCSGNTCEVRELHSGAMLSRITDTSKYLERFIARRAQMAFDPHGDAACAQFVESMADQCSCKHDAPCDSVLGGGICSTHEVQPVPDEQQGELEAYRKALRAAIDLARELAIENRNQRDHLAVCSL